MVEQPTDKYRTMKTIIGQCIRGQMPARDVSLLSARWSASPSAARLDDADSGPESNCIYDADPLNLGDWKSPSMTSSEDGQLTSDQRRFLQHRETSASGFAQSCTPSSLDQSADDKSYRLRLELDELKMISNSNESHIAWLLKKLNSLKVSTTLLNEEKQRLEHSRQIRTVNVQLLLNMLKGRCESEQKKRRSQLLQFERAAEIVETIFGRLARMEELKMILEYDNTRNLYVIREMKNEIAELEKAKRELSKKLNCGEGNS